MEALSPTLNTVCAPLGMLELLTETGSVTLAASTREALHSSAEVTRELVPTRDNGRRPEVWPLLFVRADLPNQSQKVPLLSSTKRPVANDRIARGLGRLRGASKQTNKTQETQTL